MKSLLPSGLTARLLALRDGLTIGLVERDTPIRLALLAALSGEHLLLVGPPGTGKSLVARRLHHAFGSATYFERLLTRFSVPEELFGPLSIKGLEEDRYERLTDSYLPKASVAFLDEIFKANSAILNALLTLLNEREFDNGTRRERSPLIAVVGASNELPSGEELEALFDRFLLRYHVGPVSGEAFPALLRLQGEPIIGVSPEHQLSDEDLAAIRRAVVSVAVPEDVIALLSALREWCAAEKITVSDRRWRKIVKLLQTSALTNGRSSVSIWDCWLLQHCVWSAPEQRAKAFSWFAERAGASAAMDPSRLTRIVVSWEGQLKRDEESRSQMRDADANPLFRGPNGQPTTASRGEVQRKRGAQSLFLAPADATNEQLYSSSSADRSNSGKGYTVAELDRLAIMDVTGARVRFAHWANREMYLANRANWLTEDVELSPCIEPTRHKKAYIEACLAELDDVRHAVEGYLTQMDAHIGSLEVDIRDHLWVTVDFAEHAARSLNSARTEVSMLLARLSKVRRGFDMLPRDS